MTLDIAKELFIQAEYLKMWWYMNYLAIYIIIPLMNRNLVIEFL